MEPVNYKIIKDFGVLSGSNIFFRLIDWSGFKKYDLRHWDDKGVQPYKGITFEEEELPKLLELLQTATAAEKSETPITTVTMGKITAGVLNDFGSLSQKGDRSKKITYTNWGRAPKYDIRPWAEDYSSCGKGITLSQTESEALIELLKTEVQK